MRTLALVFVLSLVPASALACEASVGGARSFDLRVSPQAGTQCLYTLTEYEGGACDAAHVIATETEPCNVTRRLVLMDDGVFVSIAAPRTSHRSWTIVRTFTIGENARHAEHSLEELPATTPLRGVVRVTFDQGAVVFRDRASEVRVPFTELTLD